MKKIPAIVEGKITKQKAMLDAGYSKETAREQSSVLGSIGIETAMQKALRKANVTEERLSVVIDEGLELPAANPTRLGYVKTSAELLDVVPAKKGELELKGSINLTQLYDDSKGA